MVHNDLILDADHKPSYEEILTYMAEPALTWWKTLNTFIQEKYHIKPKTTYSNCSMQKGWNVKYQKSGKSLCTLYPEQHFFTILIVVKLELAHIISAMTEVFEPVVLDIVASARPFNGTKWLSIPVKSEAILKNVQELLVMKQERSSAQ
ncbi:Protein of unknown function DUF3788 [Syntrophomonas zehnderi OL-4]|uniref:DUF3788 domain-containing protein n=1 Tax=Syntrophomonas zehnderi OL-4 TaxID=690567 RepID=A0A0E3W3S6_9FIRM|nr:DUF3788 domain-containing protein [Syntrophomonas zehnderi]CFY02227.1 Protein of unknown function DUF3788 [Syntrophomonas zehnderi OL-4]